MKKVIRLTESDLVRLINRVISEQSTEGEIESMPTFLKALEKFPTPSPFIQYFLFDVDYKRFKSIMNYSLGELMKVFGQRGVKDAADIKMQINNLENYEISLEKAYNKVQKKGSALSYLNNKEFNLNSKPEKQFMVRSQLLKEKMNLVLKSLQPGPSNPPRPSKPSTPPRPSNTTGPTSKPRV